jgi:hypothetical protein
MLSVVGGDIGSGTMEIGGGGGGVDLVQSFREGLKVLIIP